MSFGGGFDDGGDVGAEDVGRQTGPRGPAGSLGEASARRETYMREFDPQSPSYGGRPPGVVEAAKYNIFDRYTPGEAVGGFLTGLVNPLAGVARTGMNLMQAGRDIQGGPGATWNTVSPRDMGQTLGKLDPVTGRYSLVDVPTPPEPDYGSPVVKENKKVVPAAASPQRTSSTGTSPRTAVRTSAPDTDRAVTRTTRSGTRSASILTSPFGDLSQAPTTRKTLLGA